MEENRHSEAIEALRNRGVDTPTSLLEYGTPEQILAACRRWDRREGVGAGLLVRWIRDQDFSEPEPPAATSKAEQLRRAFDEFVRQHPVDSVFETHAELIERRWPADVARARETGQELCPGWMIVAAADYPTIEAECEGCGFEVGIPAGALPR